MELGWPGCAPSPLGTVKTSPNTQPALSGLMLGPTSVLAVKMGCSTCLWGGLGINSITRARSSQPLCCPLPPAAGSGPPMGSCLACAHLKLVWEKPDLGKRGAQLPPKHTSRWAQREGHCLEGPSTSGTGSSTAAGVEQRKDVHSSL